MAMYKNGLSVMFFLLLLGSIVVVQAELCGEDFIFHRAGDGLCL